MMWGIDYSPDGYVWFTDETYDSLWRFSPDTQKYQRLSYPSEGNSLPQRLKVEGSQIIVNDFTGNKITFLDPAQTGEDTNYLSLPSPVDNSVTSDFTVDEDDNVWYTNWIFQEGGVLVKYDHAGFQQSVSASEEDSLPLFDFIEVYELPPEILTPNGVTIDQDGKIRNKEWKAIRAEARKQVLAKINRENRAHHILSRADDTSHPYILSATDEEELVARKKFRAYTAVSGAFLILVALVVMSAIRPVFQI